MIFRKDDFKDIVKILKNTSFKYLHIKVNCKDSIPQDMESEIDSYYYEYIIHLKDGAMNTHSVYSIINKVHDFKLYDPPVREKDYVTLSQQKINSIYETKGPQLLAKLTKEYKVEDVEVYFTKEPQDTKHIIYKLDYTNK